MGNQTSYFSLEQSFFNSITQQNQEKCVATVDSNVSGNIVIITNSTFLGNVTGIKNNVYTDASCTITSSMESSVSNLLESTLNQENKSSAGFSNIFGGDQNQSGNVKQSTSNFISQLNTEICNSSDQVSTGNNYIYASGDKATNFIGIDASSQAYSSCSMTNYMKTTVSNSASSTASQTNKKTGLLVLLIILAVVVGVLVLIGGGVTAFVKSSGKGKEEGNEGNEGNERNERNEGSIANLLTAGSSSESGIEMEELGQLGETAAIL